MQAVFNDRVKGQLKVTRAFGAGFLKKVGDFICFIACLSSEWHRPHCHLHLKILLTKRKSKFLMLCREKPMPTLCGCFAFTIFLGEFFF